MEHQRSSRVNAAIAIAASVTIAFLLRVLPAYGPVFAKGIVDFQEPDAWFHLRTVHNLLAHFPHRSGFDPYVLFPGGQDVPTGPVWDYLLAIPAWILGWGAPSPGLIDRVAAWLPAIVGALFPIPAFFLARRLCGTMAGFFAALWMAVGFGDFLWTTHLGLADHHAAEVLFAFLALTWMCMAIDGVGMRFAWLSGIALGFFMGTRPAGIFVPATLACFVMVEPLAAPAVLRASLAAAALFFPLSGGLWLQYSWLALAGAGVLSAGAMALDSLARRRGWPPRARRLAPLAAAVAGFALALVTMPHLFHSLWYEIRRLLGFDAASRIVSTVQELQPIYRAGPRAGWPSIFAGLGAVWIPALPAFAWLALRSRRPAVRLLILWTAVMACGTILEIRMAPYFLPAAHVLAGVTCGWLIGRVRFNYRRLAAAALAMVVLAVNLPWAIPAVRDDAGVNADWIAAFDWLRDNTPNPMGDPGAWSRYYPSGSHAAGSWGVAVWWDHAYAMEFLAHRIPMSNGTQAGAETMARFYTETIPEAAVDWLRRSGARYVVVDPLAPLFAGEIGSRFPVQIRMLGRNLDTYMQTLARRDEDGSLKSMPIYLPTYYQSMAARLYLTDGEEVKGTGPWVFETEPTTGPRGKTVELITSSRHFNTQTEADAYLQEHQSARLTVGCLDPGTSCFPLPAVKGLKRVFTSEPVTISSTRVVRAVKIFEVTTRDELRSSGQPKGYPTVAANRYLQDLSAVNKSPAR